MKKVFVSAENLFVEANKYKADEIKWMLKKELLPTQSNRVKHVLRLLLTTVIELEKDTESIYKKTLCECLVPIAAVDSILSDREPTEINKARSEAIKKLEELSKKHKVHVSEGAYVGDTVSIDGGW